MDLRRLQLVIAIAYNADLLRAKEIIAKTLHEDPRVLAEPPALVAVGNLSDKVELFVQPGCASPMPTRSNTTCSKR